MSDLLAFDFGSAAPAWTEPTIPDAVIADAVASVATVARCREGVAKIADAPIPAWSSKGPWNRLVRDAKTFSDLWLERAVECGWSVNEMFGMNPKPDARRVDLLGLVPLISGRDILALDAFSAVIRNPIGDAGRYYLGFDRSAAVPLWDVVKGRAGR